MTREKLTLSVLVPVYNERFLVETSLNRLLVLKESPNLEGVQIIVCDDCSNDGTTEILNNFHKKLSEKKDDFFEWIFLRHEINSGKGKAIQTALTHATGYISIIHDADLEYNPKDIIKIISVFTKEHADAVYGSRFLAGEYHRALMYHHELGNKFLTFLCNTITNINLTDMETCYKAIRTNLFKSIPIESNDFRLEPELTIKLAKRGCRIFEVPISYSGRDYEEGKKINWKDGVKALLAMGKYWISDEIYKEEKEGTKIFFELSRAAKYNKWIANKIKPYVGSKVFEISCGLGNYSKYFFPRDSYIVTDVNSFYLDHLKNMSLTRPYLKVFYFDVNDMATFPGEVEEDCIDTVICMNVLEHIEDDKKALSNIRSILKKGGRAIVFVPNAPSIFGTYDEVLGHHRRYTRESLKKLFSEFDFEVEEILGINRLGSLAWWLNGKLLRRKSFSKFQIWMMNILTPLFKILDLILPLPYLSLVAIARFDGDPEEDSKIS